MQPAQFAKILELAGHVSTDEMTALNSIRRIRSILAEEGVSFAELICGEKEGEKVPAVAKFMSNSDMRHVISLQEQEITKLRQEITKLTIEVQTLNRKLSEEKELPRQVKPDENDSVSYGVFAAEVIKRLGKPKGWQREFNNQTGYSVSQINQWGQPGKAVPWEAYLKAMNLTPKAQGTQRGAVPWTVELVDIVRSMTNEGKPERVIASKIGEILNREVTEGQIKRLKINSREGVGVFADSAFGGSIGQSRT